MAQKKKKEKTASELDMALALSDAVEIKEVIFTESHCKLFGVDRDAEEKKNVELFASTEYSEENEGKILLTRVRFKFIAKNKKDETVVLLEAVYIVVYSVNKKGNFADSHYSSFSEYCSVFHLWPYWREFVQRSIANFGLPPLTLPVFKFGSKLPKEGLQAISTDIKQ